jgi:hypothetical protein
MVIRVFAALALAAVACGCDTTAEQQPRPPAPVATRSTANFTLPFDRYRFSTPEQDTIQSALDRQTARCLEKHGVSWTAAPSTTRSELTGNARRYGLIDAQTAHDYGYHLPASNRNRPQQTNEKIHTCKKQASEQLLHGTERIDQTWFNDLNFTSAERSDGTSEVLRVTAEWSRCMRTAGFSYTDPLAAISDHRWNLDSPTASADEITAAITDVRCKLQTHLVNIRAATETRIQQQLIAATPNRFTAIERWNQHVLANAQLMLVG